MDGRIVRWVEAGDQAGRAVGGQPGRASIGIEPETRKRLRQHIGAQLRRNVPADLVIMSREGLNDLVTEGLILPKSDVDLASTPLGMAVRAGAPKPDIATLDAFRQTLLGAKSVTFPASTSGIYLTKTVFPRLGIASEMAAKSRFIERRRRGY